MSTSAPLDSVNSATITIPSATYQSFDNSLNPDSEPSNPPTIPSSEEPPQPQNQPVPSSTDITTTTTSTLYDQLSMYSAGTQLQPPPINPMPTIPLSLPLNITPTPTTTTTTQQKPPDTKKDDPISSPATTTAPPPPNPVTVPVTLQPAYYTQLAAVTAVASGTTSTPTSTPLPPSVSQSWINAANVATNNFLRSGSMQPIVAPIVVAPPIQIHVPELQMASAYRIGRYTPAERRIRIARYREKRAQRNYNRRVKYDCRKTIADKRVRVQGRFVKRAEEQAIVKRKNSCGKKTKISASEEGGSPLTSGQANGTRGEGAFLNVADQDNRSSGNVDVGMDAGVDMEEGGPAGASNESFDVSDL